MAQLPNYQQIQEQDLPTNDPFSVFLPAYNLFASDVYNSFNGQITIGSNIQGALQSSTFTTPPTYSDGVNTNFTAINFKWNFSGSPSTVIVGNVVPPNNVTLIKPVTVPGFTYSQTNSVVTVPYVTGLAAGSKYTITFLVF